MIRFGGLLVGAVAVAAAIGLGCSDREANHAAAVAVAAAIGLGCSDREANHAAAVAAAEELAAAALLTEGDLPAGDWQVGDLDFEQFSESVSIEAERYDELPEECKTPDGPAELISLPGGLATARGRTFAPDQTASVENVVGILLSVMVFENAEGARGAAGEADGRYQSIDPNRECIEARAASLEAETYDIQSEASRYGLADDHSYRRRTTITYPANTTAYVVEVHTFVGGRVVASYMALGSDDAAREIDHQRLLEAFEARVVAVQE